MFKNASQNRFVNVSLHGTRDKDLPVCHTLFSEERKLLCLRGTRLRKQSIWERHPALHERFCLSNIGRRVDASTFGMRLQE